MFDSIPGQRIGLLLSGGLDSSILAGWFDARGYRVQPFYIESGLWWQQAERAALDRFLAQFSQNLEPLVTLTVPLHDLYDDHWCLTGKEVPSATAPDEAVFLPGRNLVLISKAALWCQMHGIEHLALAALGTSPFADASSDFFQHLEMMFNQSGLPRLSLARPFEQFDKRQVMELGSHLPLHATFSCINPIGSRHCGGCNKCRERQEAFASIDMADPTDYAQPLPTAS